MATTSEQLSEVLFDILINEASDEHVKQIADIITKLKTSYFRSYAGLQKHPFASNVLQGLEEACHYRNEMGE